MVKLPNNHILDFGPDCLLDTIAALDASAIAHVGAGRTCEEALAPAILERDGVRVGSLGAARRGLRRLAGWSR